MNRRVGKRKVEQYSAEDVAARKRYKEAAERLNSKLEFDFALQMLDVPGAVRALPESKSPKNRISNMVTGVKLGVPGMDQQTVKPLDLVEVLRSLGGGHFRADNFTGFRLRLGISMRAALLLFETGSFLLAGAKYRDQILVGIGILRHLLQKKYSPQRLMVVPNNGNYFMIRNMVLNMRFPFGLDLNMIHRTIPQTTYVPKLFPCLFWNIARRGHTKGKRHFASVLLTSNGKVVIAGIKNPAPFSAVGEARDFEIVLEQISAYFESKKRIFPGRK